MNRPAPPPWHATQTAVEAIACTSLRRQQHPDPIKAAATHVAHLFAKIGRHSHLLRGRTREDIEAVVADITSAPMLTPRGWSVAFLRGLAARNREAYLTTATNQERPTP